MKLGIALLSILLGIALILSAILLTKDLKSLLGGIVLLGIGIRNLLKKPKVAKQSKFEEVMQDVKKGHQIKL